MNTTNMDLDKFITLAECAEWLGVTPTTLSVLSKGPNPQIPAVWFNKRLVRFHPRTVLAKFEKCGSGSLYNLPNRIRQQRKTKNTK